MAMLPFPYTIIKEETGEIVSKGLGMLNEDHEIPEGMVGLGEVLIRQQAPDRTYWKGGQFVPLPGSADNHFCIFDYVAEEWIDPRSLDVLRVEKRQQIKLKRDKIESTMFPYLGKWFNSDLVSVARINTAIKAAEKMLAAGIPYDITWTCADDTELVMTSEQLIDMPVALAGYSMSLHATARVLKEQIKEAKTKEELALIEWPELQFVPGQ